MKINFFSKNINIIKLTSLLVHPIYKNYGYSVGDHNVYHIRLNKIVKQIPSNSGYAMCTVSDGEIHKSFLCHRFVWECYNDIIPKNYEIDHINKDKLDNKIENLRCVTINENRKNRDHTNIINNAKNAHKMRRCIKAINSETNEFNCFTSKTKCSKYLGISPALIYLIIENKNRTKTANTNKGKFTFEYVDEKDLENLIEIPHGRLGKIYKVV